MNPWWYCQDCPGVYTTYDKAAKHVDDTGHRLEAKEDKPVQGEVHGDRIQSKR